MTADVRDSDRINRALLAPYNTIFGRGQIPFMVEVLIRSPGLFTFVEVGDDCFGAEVYLLHIHAESSPLVLVTEVRMSGYAPVDMLHRISTVCEFY